MHILDYKFCTKCFSMYNIGLQANYCNKVTLVPDARARIKVSPSLCGGEIETRSIDKFMSSDRIGPRNDPVYGGFLR
jgi:hypothetical protein